jgi:hypothetical protein
MFLMDDALFRLWREGLCEKEAVLLKCQKPLDLADRIRASEEGALDEDDDEVEDDDEADDDDDDDRPRRKRRPPPRGKDDDDDDD